MALSSVNHVARSRDTRSKRTRFLRTHGYSIIWAGILGMLLVFVSDTSAALASPLAQAGAIVQITKNAEDPSQLQPKSQIGHAAMPPDIQQILHRGKLTVAVLGQDNPPFFMATERGQVEGADIQFAQALADQLGVTLDINRSAQTFDDVVDTVYQLKADLAISKVSRTLKRAQRVRFSQPYLRMRQGLLVNRLQLAQQVQGRSMEETIRNLKGKVGVLRNSSYVGFLKQKFPQATIVEFQAWPDIVDAVVRGNILAAYRDELEVKKVVRTKPDAALQLQTIALTDTQDSLAVVLPWNSTHLLAFIDQYLETLVTQYTVDGLLDEYAEYWTTQRSSQP